MHVQLTESVTIAEASTVPAYSILPVLLTHYLVFQVTLAL